MSSEEETEREDEEEEVMPGVTPSSYGHRLSSHLPGPTAPSRSHAFCLVYSTLNILPFLSLPPKFCLHCKAQINPHFPAAPGGFPNKHSSRQSCPAGILPTLHPTPRWELTPKPGCWWDSLPACVSPLPGPTVLPGSVSKPSCPDPHWPCQWRAEWGILGSSIRNCHKPLC